MARWSPTHWLCLIALPAAVCAGCQSAKPSASAKKEPLPEAPPKLVESWESAPVGLPRGGSHASGPVAMAEGRPPLAYIVPTGGGGTIRVVDQTAGRDLAEAAVPARTLVRVDARRGVIFGSDEMLKGPLAGDHTYVIYVQPEAADNTVRRGTFRPGPREPAAAPTNGTGQEPTGSAPPPSDLPAGAGGR